MQSLGRPLPSELLFRSKSTAFAAQREIAPLLLQQKYKKSQFLSSLAGTVPTFSTQMPARGWRQYCCGRLPRSDQLVPNGLVGVL